MNLEELRKKVPDGFIIIKNSEVSPDFLVRDRVTTLDFWGRCRAFDSNAVITPDLLLPKLPIFASGVLRLVNGFPHHWAIDAVGRPFMQRDSTGLRRVPRAVLLYAAKLHGGPSLEYLIENKMMAARPRLKTVTGRMSVSKKELTWDDSHRFYEEARKMAKEKGVAVVTAVQNPCGEMQFGDTFPNIPGIADRAKELTKRLRYMYAAGMSNRKIAHDLGLSIDDVNDQRLKFDQSRSPGLSSYAKADAEQTGKTLVHFDYDQLETRIAAEMYGRIYGTDHNPKFDFKELAKRFLFGDRPIVRPKDPLLSEEILAQDDGKWVDEDEMKAVEEAGLGWMLRPFKYHDGAFGHPDLLAALDEFDDINWDEKLDAYKQDADGNPIFHMPLAEFLRRCRLNERHKR